MEKVKKEEGRDIVVLDEGMDVNAAGDSVRGFGICCWANIMILRAL
jgi:hypothetical protein